MKQLFGYVLIKETNVGVPNLVVVAFDSRDVPGDSSLDGQRRPSSVQLLRMGRRIGSVLTDKQGSFAIDRENLEFQGNEVRPNLMVAVFAPEDVRSLENPVSAPPEDRLLFVTKIARADAGAEEAFVIRLLQAQLDRFNIASSVAKAGDGAGSRLGDAIESAWDVPDYLKDRFQKRIKAQLDLATKMQDRAKKATQNLSGIPVHLRDAKGTPNFFQNNALLLKDRSDLRTELPRAQVQSVTEGLAAFAARPAPTVRIWLTAAQMRANGLKVDNQGQVSGVLSSPALVSLVRAQMSGTDLVKKRGLNNPSPEELRRRYLMPTAAAPIPVAQTTAAAATTPAPSQLPAKRAPTKKPKGRGAPVVKARS